MHNLRSTKTTPFCHSCLDMLSKVWFRPKAVHNNEVVDEFANDYTYFACIKFINSVCLTAFPFLKYLVQINTWENVSAGMTKTYAAEVLGKLPSILYEGPPPPSGTDEESVHDGHIHEGGGACAGYLSRVLLLRRREESQAR
ncbi:hypothetical protein BKA82DRAFT_4182029 [Pisolithus tinctorius]|nr:hypothetical protein BKA82DRAFT_4182029 [Pisolithus tinctorius]